MRNASLGKGIQVQVGISGAMETLCGQAYGAKEYAILGVYLQASVIVTSIVSIPLTVLFLYAEPVLLLIGQDIKVSSKVSVYLRGLIPGIYAFAITESLVRFLQAQSIVMPLTLCSLFLLMGHVFLCYILVHMTNLRFGGAALANSISYWLLACCLILYVKHASDFEKTWKGFSRETFKVMRPFLKLAFQSAIMVCFEYWIFEIFIILSGLFPQPEISTSLIALCESTEAIVYMLITGYGAAISTRVANELGAGCPSVAKSAICLTVKIGILVAIIVSMFLFLADSVWASAFTNSERIKTKFSSMVPLLSASILLDALQGIFSGVARGCGCQALAAYTNLLSFYVIVMPVALILGFVLKLHDKGLWIGLICGLFFQSVIMIIITLRIDWTKEAKGVVIGVQREEMESTTPMIQ